MLAQIFGGEAGLGVPRLVERDVRGLVNPPGVALGFAVAKEDEAPRARLKRPRTLAEIKADARFQESPLLRQGRLSVVPLTAAQHKWLTGP